MGSQIDSRAPVQPKLNLASPTTTTMLSSSSSSSCRGRGLVVASLMTYATPFRVDTSCCSRTCNVFSSFESTSFVVETADNGRAPFFSSFLLLLFSFLFFLSSFSLSLSPHPLFPSSPPSFFLLFFCSLLFFPPPCPPPLPPLVLVAF